MLLPLQQSTIKYNYPTPATFRNKTMPSFRSTTNMLRLNNKLYSEVQKIKYTHGDTTIFRLAMAGLAALAGIFGKMKDSEYTETLSAEIKPNIENIQAEKITYLNTQNTNDYTQTEQETAVQQEYTEKKDVIAPQKTISKRPARKIITNEEIQGRYKHFIDEKPERERFFIYLEDYPELLKKYQNLIRKRILNECDRNVRDNLKGFEKILRRLPEYEEKYINAQGSEKDRKINPADLLNSLNTTYLDSFDDMCSMFYKEQDLFERNRGRKIMHIMHAVAKKELNPNHIKEYLKYPNITYYEYNSIKSFRREDILQYANDIKENNVIDFRLVKSKKFENIPNFAIRFDSEISTNERLKVIVEVFEKLNGKVTLHTGKANGDGTFCMSTLFDELHFRLRKDNIITPLYNFVKFISPETLKEYNYTEDELNNITRPEEEDLEKMKNGTISPEDKEKFEKFIEMTRKIGSALAFIDDNEKCKEIIEVINDKEIFHDCIDNLHAILRFICRFVINEKYNPENGLKEECKIRAEALKSSLGLSTTANSTVVQVYRYDKKRGIAPRFYLADECKLGPDISVTLNNEGHIHTIFENLTTNTGRKYIED